MMFFTTLFAAVSALVSVANAIPLGTRDVVDPPITSPDASTVWHAGETQTVTWSTANLPSQQTTSTGMLVLGYQFNNSENLMLENPLATGFKYTDGQAQITVPDVPTRNDYIIVLFGDSGNASPEFTIMGSSSSSSSASATPAPSSSASASTVSSPAAPPSASDTSASESMSSFPADSASVSSSAPTTVPSSSTLTSAPAPASLSGVASLPPGWQTAGGTTSAQPTATNNTNGGSRLSGHCAALVTPFVIALMSLFVF